MSKNRIRIAKSLRDEFKKASCIRIAETDVYKELMNWLCGITGEEDQSIIYAIDRIEDD